MRQRSENARARRGQNDVDHMSNRRGFVKFVTLRELRLQTPRVLRKVSRGEKVIITNRGKPQAALVRLTEDDIDDVV